MDRPARLQRGLGGVAPPEQIIGRRLSRMAAGLGRRRSCGSKSSRALRWGPAGTLGSAARVGAGAFRSGGHRLALIPIEATWSIRTAESIGTADPIRAALWIPAVLPWGTLLAIEAIGPIPLRATPIKAVATGALPKGAFAIRPLPLRATPVGAVAAVAVLAAAIAGRSVIALASPIAAAAVRTTGATRSSWRTAIRTEAHGQNGL